MLPVKIATLAALTQLFFTFSNTVAAESPDIPTGLIQELHQWIDIKTELPEADSAAKIVFAGAQDVAEPSEMASIIGSKPRGLYDPDSGTITLVRPWSADNQQDVAVLLHELVHHRQRGTHFYCEAAKERAAYDIQRDWLADRGLSLNVNWIAVIVASSCAARDIHPKRPRELSYVLIE
ncbi:DUF6647 family protein [Sneathiella sp.]|uniref:DUF6647 family protein n=1 Tax=Sneathiella sp. TaxID=1964365 RepID=UPI0025DF08BB|nr:DUF6647 family protein [Sneathiella sp.]